MVSKTLQRILLFIIVLPGLALLAFWDFEKHLPLVIVILLASMVGAMETAGLIRMKGINVNLIISAFLGLTWPLLAYFEIIGWISSQVSMIIITFIIIVIFVRQIFLNQDDDFIKVLGKTSGYLLILVYPGLFFLFSVYTLNLESASLLISIFAVAIYCNDANAWLWGNLFGQKSIKLFIVSPQKSLIGFLGGIFATFVVLITSYFWFPGLLGENLLNVVILAVVLSFTTIIGDLFESSLKRSAQVKDSGNLIPGRGGLLDSIDSVLFSAPVYYVFLMWGR